MCKQMKKKGIIEKKKQKWIKENVKIREKKRSSNASDGSDENFLCDFKKESKQKKIII